MIKIQNLCFAYSENSFALKNINIDADSGQIIALIGANGSGKSTLLNLIGGIYFTKYGNILANNIEISKKQNPVSVRRNVGIVFQNPNNQVIFDKVHDDISFTLNNLNFKQSEIENQIKLALQSVGLPDFLNRNPYELSLGQKQRVAIASILATGTNNLLFDEPTTMLDPSNKQNLLNLFKKLKAENKTIIFSTNNLDEILVADKIVILCNGEISKRISPQELVADLSLLNSVGLKPTYKLKLLNLLETSTPSLEELKAFVKEENK